MTKSTPAFQPFLMERMMSHFEQGVDFNLSESGVHPATLAELIGDDAGFVGRLLATELNYPHVNGIPELRERIAALYPGAGPENVLVTVGAAEANYITTITLAGPGDTVAVMLPNYMQVWGIAQNLAMRVRSFHLDESARWMAQPAGIAEAVNIRDVDGLHGPDTVAKFRVPESGIQCNDTDVSLTGETYAGDIITGSDSIDATECETGCHAY